MIKKDEKKMDHLQLDVTAAELNDVPLLVPRRKRNTERKGYNMSFRMANETADLLNKIAADRNTSMQDLVGLAVDRWLREEKIGYFKKP